MAHMYKVDFSTIHDHVRRDYSINLKAANQKRAKEIAKEKWENRYYNYTAAKKCPHMFYLVAERVPDDISECKFELRRMFCINVDKVKDPFTKWIFS